MVMIPENSRGPSLSSTVRGNSRARVLLLDSDLRHAEHVIQSLTPVCVTEHSFDIDSATERLQDSDFDIVIVTSRHAFDWNGFVSVIHNMTLAKATFPSVIVFARAYRGPQERLEAERKGIRLLYEG